jgi:hypothetical protein
MGENAWLIGLRPGWQRNLNKELEYSPGIDVSD